MENRDDVVGMWFVLFQVGTPVVIMGRVLGRSPTQKLICYIAEIQSEQEDLLLFADTVRVFSGDGNMDVFHYFEYKDALFDLVAEQVCIGLLGRGRHA